MILPITAYGHPVLKKAGSDILSDYPQLANLITDMWETMYYAKGVGLAAPQIGLSIRLFIVDTLQINDEEEGKVNEGIKKVFINPLMVEEKGSLWTFEEGCLSIPNLTGDVERQSDIVIKYYDENFDEHIDSFNGMTARVIQHEYDHIEGKLFIEKLSPLKRKLISRKLDNIKKGKVTVNYRMRFYQGI